MLKAFYICAITGVILLASGITGFLKFEDRRVEMSATVACLGAVFALAAVVLMSTISDTN